MNYEQKIINEVKTPPVDAICESRYGNGFNIGYTNGHEQAKCNCRSVAREADISIAEYKSAMSDMIVLMQGLLLKKDREIQKLINVLILIAKDYCDNCSECLCDKRPCACYIAKEAVKEFHDAKNTPPLLTKESVTKESGDKINEYVDITFVKLMEGDRFIFADNLWTKISMSVARQHRKHSIDRGAKGYGYKFDTMCSFDSGDVVKFVPPTI